MLVVIGMIIYNSMLGFLLNTSCVGYKLICTMIIILKGINLVIEKVLLKTIGR